MYKIKGSGNLVMAHYKSKSWRFYVAFSEKIRTKKVKRQFDIFCPSENAFIDGIRFFHVKSMLRFFPHSLNHINANIVSLFGGRSVSCEVKSYTSNDRLRHYLYLSMETEGEKLEYVLIIRNSEFYNCVINKSKMI